MRYIFSFCIEFDISCVVCRLDGANAPITISSKITLDKLRIAVAEKLDRFPGLITLQYRLSSDNTEARAISIQTSEELKLFKDRMRTLIVPPRLANGKASTRIPKAVLVFFEDTSGEIKEVLPPPLVAILRRYWFFIILLLLFLFYYRILQW